MILTFAGKAHPVSFTVRLLNAYRNRLKSIFILWINILLIFQHEVSWILDFCVNRRFDNLTFSSQLLEISYQQKKLNAYY
jgi:hypothetical protein